MSARYQFLPWVRTGASSAYANADTLAPVLTRRDSRPLTALPVVLKVNTRTSVEVALRLYGPGDVIGIDARVVIRVDPPPGAADLEPNYLACVEFDTPDFPWMFTPAAAGSQGRLRPWLCLVVVRRGDGVDVRFSPERPLPMLSAPVSELPDLVESWAWAHAQVVQGDATEAVQTILTSAPQRNLSRLICPRRLEPQTQYLACVVPAFDAGRRAGLGLQIAEADENKLAPAWDGTQPQVELPVYHQWEFSTGTGGDFESLADLLEGRDAGDVGRRRLLAAGQPFGLGDPGRLELQGPLITADTPIPPAPSDDFRQRLRALLNLADEPVVTPPVYGSWQAAQPTVPEDSGTPRWLRELNLDPAARAAAGLGARVVQESQEQLVASAWEQLGDGPGVVQLERRLETGVAVLGSVMRRHVATMDPGRMVQFLGPAQTRMLTSPQTLQASLASQGLPPSISSTAFRRTLRPAGTLARRRSPAAPSLQRIARQVGTAVPAIDPPASVAGLGAIEHFQARIAADAPAKLADQRADVQPLPPDFARQRRLAALTVLGPYLKQFADEVVSAPPPATLDANLKAKLVARLDPRQTLPLRFYARLTRGGDAVAAPAQAGATVLARPSFPKPMYEALRDLSPGLLLADVDTIAPNSVTVLKSNSRFIEAYMVGLNHEIASELLWREFPGDLRHTYFLNFWDTSGVAPQPLPEMQTWSPTAPLGANLASGDGQLVLVIRGELLRRYPDALIYAVGAKDPATLGDTERMPLFRGRIDPDITFLGFALTEKQARSNGTLEPGWFFVIQEQPSAPRFGLDETRIKALASWNDLAWSDTKTVPGARLKLADLKVAAAQRPPGPVVWAFNAAHMAAILRQRPVRVAFHADRLLPPPRS
ncbi:MAG TPA: hypothetical protein VGO80_22935 [Solirubrobacteraceae bacterium]|nr:hypothetical protein [Solirubrobacteraceae bacterium]